MESLEGFVILEQSNFCHEEHNQSLQNQFKYL